MKIMLVGGTGTISAAVARELVNAGHDLTVFNRGLRAPYLPEGVRIWRGDAQDEGILAALLKGEFFDTVVDFIAYTPSDVQRDIRLFEEKTNQYVFISSASVYQKPPGYFLINESTPLRNPYWQYSRDKIACEDILVQQYRTTGFPVTIVRPSHTYDCRDVPAGLHGSKGTYAVLHRMLHGKPVIIHGDGSSWWTFTHADDFARGFVGLLGSAHAIGEAVQIMSDQSLSWNMAYDIIAAALCVKCKPVHVASRTLIALGEKHGYDFTGTLLGDKANSAVFDCQKLKRLVPGFTPRYSFERGVAESVAYILSHPERQVLDPKFDDFCNRVCDKISSL